jgi:hypothetical protein
MNLIFSPKNILSMKKLRIMLAAIIVLSTAGGVLAFKISEAKRNIRICTLEPDDNGKCPLRLCGGLPFGAKFGANIPEICYSSVPPSVNFCNQLLCTRIGQTLPQ